MSDSQFPEKPHHHPRLRPSFRDGRMSAIMLGAGENYLAAATILLHGTAVQLGILATLPQLISGLSQFVGVWFGERIRSRKILLAWCAKAQAGAWFLMAGVMALAHDQPSQVWWLLGFAALYYAFAGVINPIWSALMGDLMTPSQRGVILGKRNSLIGAVSFLAMVFAGVVLHYFESAGLSARGFALIFLIAGIARIRSSVWLFRHEDPPVEKRQGDYFSFLQFLQRTRYSNFAKFVFFAGSMNFAVAFAAPYFSLYMLRDLQMSYLEFTAVGSAAIVTQFLAIQYWGGVADRVGTKRILTFCGFGVTTVPAMWLCTTKLPYLILFQVVAGFLWAGFNLAANNFMYDAVTPPKRSRCVAYQSVVSGSLFCFGAMAGGYGASHFPSIVSLGFWTWRPASSLLVVFLVSSLLRLIVNILLLSRFREVREVEKRSKNDFLFVVTHLRPLAGVTMNIFSGRSKKDYDAAE